MAVIFSLFREWWVGPRKWATWASLQRPWRRQRPQLFQVVQRVSQGMEGMAPQPSWGHGARTFTAEWRTKAEMMLAEGLGVEAVALHNLTCECSNGCNEYQDIPGIININMFTVSICFEVLYHRVCVCVPSLHLHLPSFQMYRMYLYHFILLVSSAITDPCQRCRLPHR